MAQNDILKRYLDAGLEFAALTQARAEELVKDLVKAGEVQADQARETVAELLERSRKSSEKLIETVRTEVRSQITNLGLASQADLDRIEQRIASLLSSATAPAKKAAAREAPATKPAAKKKASAKKKPAKKKSAKSTAKKA
jgi:polyhydroxyalkanoate synthesis regulator phasin